MVLFVTSMASKRGPDCDGCEESKKRRRVAFDQVAYFTIPVKGRGQRKTNVFFRALPE